MATLKLPWEVSVVKHGEEQESSGGRVKREMVIFNNLESYHWRISLAEVGNRIISLVWSNIFS